MKRTGYSIRRISRYAALTAFLCVLVAPGEAQSKPNPNLTDQHGKIDLSGGLVPAVSEALPVLRLSAQKPPEDFVRTALSAKGIGADRVQPLSAIAALSAKEGAIPPGFMGAFDGGHLAAYWNTDSGDTEIFPTFDDQKAVKFTSGNPQISRAASLAKEVFDRPEILGRDATQFDLGEPVPVLGQTAQRSAGQQTVADGDRMLYLTYVPVRRSVNGHPVYGPGSRAALALGNDGSVQGFVRHWKNAVPAGQVTETRSQAQVQAEIQLQLQPLTQSADVTVLSVEAAYYDSNGDLLQPVYRITARIHHGANTNATAAPGKQADDDFVVSYLPIGGTSLPPVSRPILPSLDFPAKPGNAPPGDPTVGRYVVRNDDSNWVADANEFWSGITAWFGWGLFTNSQYYWAYPFEFNTSELSYVNSVQVGLNEVHGNWWYFTTYQNWGDGVDITAIPASQGYGPARGGNLDYWILHSCEVVPSAIDAPCPTDSRAWWTPWFNVFQGLHSVVGYRTIMYIDDDVGYPFGLNLRFGASVVSAWFNAVNGAPDYFSHPTATAHCGTALIMGKPSTISVCGHENDNVFNTSALPAASCLHNIWQN